MPDTPTGSGGEMPGHATTDSGGEGRPGAATPPDGDAYRWHGPSGPPYPGPGPGTPPYGAPYDPYQTPPGRYGFPQSPYTPSSQQPPYAWPYVPTPRTPLSPEERRRRRRRGLVMVATVVLAVGAGIGIGAAIAPTSPVAAANALVNGAIAATNEAGTYHYVEGSTTAGFPYDIKGAAGPNGGLQEVSQTCRPVGSTTKRTSLFDLRLVHGVVYFRGNVVALVDELGVSAPRAGPIVGKWVKVLKGEPPYKTFADGITTRSNSSQLHTVIIPTSSKPVPGSSPASTEVDGALFRTGKTNELLGTATLVMGTSTGLPRRLRGSAVVTTHRYTLTWTFSRYGATVEVAPPSTSLSYTSLHATPPAAGTCY